jgi:uncharacterized NAD(P)/FAD-binding protein YdhS
MTDLTKTIHVVGNGAAGIAMVVRLIRDHHENITWYGGQSVWQEFVGRAVEGFPYGMAYRTNNQNHYLNAPARSMSIPGEVTFPDFLMEQRHHPVTRSYADEAFAPRSVYRQYLRKVLENHWTDIQKHTVFLPELPEVTEELMEHQNPIILCCGAKHQVNDYMSDRGIQNPWDFDYARLEKADHIRIYGSGLTALDTAISVWTVNPNAHIDFISRNGRFPLVAGDIDRTHFDAIRRKISGLLSVREIFSTLRKDSVVYGWQAVMESMRHEWKHLWRLLPMEERIRFTKRLKPIWEIHRHKMIPETADFLKNHSHNIYKIQVGNRSYQNMSRVDFEFNATGVDTNPYNNTLVKSMIHKRMVSSGLIGTSTIGLQGDESCKVGHGIWCVGAYMRPERWEATAMADIIQMVEIVALQLKT